MHFFTEEKLARLLRDIKAAIYRESHPIPRFKFALESAGVTLPGAHLPDFDDSAWADFQVMDYWGGYDVTAWFRASVPIPAHLRGQRLVLRFLVGPRDGGNSTAETLLYINGSPLQAIDVWHEAAWLPPEYSQQPQIQIALHAWSGVLGVPDRRRFRVAELNWVDSATEQFYYQADSLLQAVQELDANDWRRGQILQGLNAAFQPINFSKAGSAEFYDSMELAAAQLAAHLDSLRGLEARKPRITALGHSHIDLAWLWRVRHTRQKARRTFATMLHLMRQYPEFYFLHSSPQLYAWLEQDDPALFAQVKERIASGQWEITGGMWVEADVNLPSGESLIRQFLLGRRYIREAFGQETRLLWLPDVFGYSGALPQIIKGCAVDYFMTTKISWSQVNRFPYDSFLWRGIDGSEVLTHFITTPDPGSWFYTYNGQLRPQDIKGIWEAYRQKAENEQLLLAFGWGDGGGGPTSEMLEQARVMQDVPGFPHVETGKAEPFFAALAERTASRDLPIWDGELYLEYHRGTYTSQAASKRANRKMELLYHDAELLSSMADVLLQTQAYPAATLTQGWQLLLLNQFHDILPGSSIRQVYEDSQADYQQIQAIGDDALAQAQSAIVQQIAIEAASLVVFNTLSHSPRRDYLQVPALDALRGKTLLTAAGQPAPVQVVQHEQGEALLFALDELPALGYHSYALTDAPTTTDSPLSISPSLIQTPHYRLALNDTGQITALYDRGQRRELLAPGQLGNRLIAFEDRPLNFDAWDIDLFYQEKAYEIRDLIEAVVEESGPLRATLRLRWRFYDSTITQRLSLYQHSRRIDFRTEIDWHEQQILLKAAFVVNIRSPRATYGIQFGAIERPTHWNTSWDYARFEVPAQQWADLSEGNYGVALLNDCKYGYDIKDQVMRLSLLKSATSPDESADQGQHRFTYSLLPHAGDWRAGQVCAEAAQLNSPLRAALLPSPQAGPLPPRYQFASSSESVVVETVKRAEDGQGWIVRVYEQEGSRHSQVTLSFGQDIRQIAHCNLVEEGEESLLFEGNQAFFEIAPYQIKTFRVQF